MPDLTPMTSGSETAAPINAPSPSAEQAPTTGSSTPSTEAGKAPDTTATETEQAESKPQSRLFKDLDDAEHKYKQVQAFATRAAQQLKELGDPAHVKGQLQLLTELSQDPKFVEWAQARLAEEATGSGDPDTVRALEIIDARAREIANEAVAPFAAQALAQKTETVFSQMEKEHGPEWEQHAPAMLAILHDGYRRGWFHPRAEVGFDLDFVQGLYAMATAKDPQHAARSYQRRLEEKQKQSTVAQPGPATAGAPKIKSIGDAFRAAVAQHAR